MKSLKCEICGNTNLLKDDGIFICQSCGTKYSIEEIKKMININDSKENTSTDNESLIDNYLMMARNAAETGNHTEAVTYCNKVIEINSKNSEAWLLKGTSTGWQSTLASIKLEATLSCYKNALSFASDNKVNEVKEKICKELTALSFAITRMSCNHFIKFPKVNTFTSMHPKLQYLLFSIVPIVKENGGNSDLIISDIANTAKEAALTVYSNASKKYKEKQYPSEYVWQEYMDATDASILFLYFICGFCEMSSEEKIKCYKKMIELQKVLIDSCSWKYSANSGGYIVEYVLGDEAKEVRKKNIMEYHNKIKELNPEYVIPQAPIKRNKPKSEGCYIATAVYGSYDCSEVWTLRRFRDSILAKRWCGRMFIKIYYAISPTLVKFFGNTMWFKNICKKPLDKLVARLIRNGIKDTPYQDGSIK